MEVAVAHSMLDYALEYATRGWAVFPLVAGGKTPLIAKAAGGNGCHDGTTNVDQIRQWYGATPLAGIGLRCGPESAVFVVDVDTKDDGLAGWERLQEIHGDVPETLAARTPSGGYHYYFRWPEGRQIGNKQKLTIDGRKYGIDVRGTGGYVVLPPSGHPSGGAYAWHWDADIAEAPPWLVDRIDPPKVVRLVPRLDPMPADRERSYAEGALRGACERIRASSGGQRHNTINLEAYKVGGYVGSGLLSHDKARAELVQAGLDCGKGASEVERTVDAGLEAGRLAPLAAPEPTPDWSAPSIDSPPGTDQEDVPDDPEDDDPRAAALATVHRGAPTKAHPAGPILRNGYNLGVILRKDPRWATRLRHNEFRGEDEIRDDGGNWRQLADVDDTNLARWISANYRLDYASATVREQVQSAANERKCHPVREYFDRVTADWDGVARMDAWLTDVFGAVLEGHTIAVGRAWLVSVVARAYSPGCKVDTVPILVGAQGALKSSTLRAMMPYEDWFSDSDIPIRHVPDKYQVLKGRLMYEIAEFDRFGSKADAAEIKAYVSSARDDYRQSYGHRPVSVPRQLVFVASTNAQEFLVDPTGSRRYWPIRCTECNPDAMRAMRDQLWAEAVRAYQDGESWWLSATAAASMSAAADEYRVEDPWEGTITAWLTGHATTSAMDVLVGALEMRKGDAGKAEQMRVTAILSRMGWKKTRPHRGPMTWARP